MAAYERSYATARGVYKVLEFVGWATVGIGAVAAFVGFSTGGIFSSFGSVPFSGRMISMIPGIIMSMFGIISVAGAQAGRVGIDSAEMTREMLMLASPT
jgi:hypothetical protein